MCSICLMIGSDVWAHRTYLWYARRVFITIKCVMWRHTVLYSVFHILPIATIISPQQHACNGFEREPADLHSPLLVNSSFDLCYQSNLDINVDRNKIIKSDVTHSSYCKWQHSYTPQLLHLVLLLVRVGVTVSTRIRCWRCWNTVL